jgi:hypothetical protein
MIKAIWILTIILITASQAYAKVQYLYNPNTNHMIIDNTARSKAEILKTFHKSNIEQYDLMILDTQEEKDLQKGTLTITIETGKLVKKSVELPQNMPAINKEALSTMLSTTLGKPAKDITAQDLMDYIDNNPLDKATVKFILKWLLYQSRSQGIL